MLKGLLIAPKLLVALIEHSLDLPHWSFDIIALTEPQCYDPRQQSIFYFDRQRCYRSLNSTPSLFEQKGRIYFNKTRSPELDFFPSKEYQICPDGFWRPSLRAQTACASFFCYDMGLQPLWHYSEIAPWLQIFQERYCLMLSGVSELGIPILLEIEQAPILEYFDRKWWFQGKSYDFCVTFGTQRSIARLLRPIFWDGSVFLSHNGGCCQRLERFLRYQDEPLWHVNFNKGFFQAPLYWPLRLDIVERQWSALITHLYTFQGVLSF